ncbi:hypothetical protein NDU88_002620 [Pleurodeles waltl]|uniref:Uncharacterized protein n=1 Tax=Pleurodeles waltl TaxID=8319 RepID=A0AAV7UXL1_PLEWA|nr:hypothetical protein NDU88_002620 [Pleurodeles waltl]
MGRLEIEKKRAISGPIGVRAEVLNWGPILGMIGPPWQPRRVLASGPSPVAREKADGPFSRLKPRPTRFGGGRPENGGGLRTSLPAAAEVPAGAWGPG